MVCLSQISGIGFFEAVGGNFGARAFRVGPFSGHFGRLLEKVGAKTVVVRALIVGEAAVAVHLSVTLCAVKDGTKGGHVVAGNLRSKKSVNKPGTGKGEYCEMNASLTRLIEIISGKRTKASLNVI